MFHYYTWTMEFQFVVSYFTDCNGQNWFKLENCQAQALSLSIS